MQEISDINIEIWANNIIIRLISILKFKLNVVPLVEESEVWLNLTSTIYHHWSPLYLFPSYQETLLLFERKQTRTLCYLIDKRTKSYK